LEPVRAASSESMLAGGGVEPRHARLPNMVEVVPGMTMAQIERAVIEATLRETRGNRRRAAELLGIGERTLYRKIREIEAGELDGATGDDAVEAAQP